MERFSFNGKEYEYDSELWQLTDLKNPEDYHTECTKTLKYIRNMNTIPSYGNSLI